ncbi:MAG: hypothetical protein U0U66_02715 [Cytophagaceae bacterium]
MRLLSTFVGICMGASSILWLAPSAEATPKKPKSNTDKRIKQQKKHQKKHPCPQIDC